MLLIKHSIKWQTLISLNIELFFVGLVLNLFVIIPVFPEHFLWYFKVIIIPQTAGMSAKTGADLVTVMCRKRNGKATELKLLFCLSSCKTARCRQSKLPRFLVNSWSFLQKLLPIEQKSRANQDRPNFVAYVCLSKVSFTSEI